MEKVTNWVYEWFDDLFCTMSFFGYRPPWYTEWYARG